MSDRVVAFKFTADTSAFKKSVALLPVDAKKNAQAYAKNIKDVKAQTVKDFEDIKRAAASAFGGTVNDLDDYAKALSVLGPEAAAAAVAIAGIALAAAGAVYGVVEITKAADGALDRLKKLEKVGLHPVDKEAEKSIREANAAMSALGTVFDEVLVKLAANFAPTVVKVSEILIELGLRASEAFDAFTEGQSILEAFAAEIGSTIIQALLSPISVIVELIKIVGALGSALGLQDNALSQLGQSYDDWTYSLALAGLGIADNAVSTELLTDRSKEYVDIQRKGIAADKDKTKAVHDLKKEQKELYDLQKDIIEIGASAADAGDDASVRAYYQAGKLNDQIDEKLAKIVALSEANSKLEGVEDARADAEAAHLGVNIGLTRDLIKADEEQVDKKIKGLEEAYAAGDISGKKAIEQAKAAYFEELHMTQALIDKGYALDDVREQMALDETERIHKLSDLNDKVSKKQLDMARDVLEGIQQITGVIVDAIDMFADAAIDLHKQNLDNLRSEKKATTKAYDDALEKYRTNQGEMTDTQKKAAQAELEQLRGTTKAKTKAIDGNIKAEQQAAMKSFHAKQMASLGEAAVASALAAVSLIPSLAYLSYGAPAAAALIAGGAFAIQAAAIMSAPAPKFHTGRSPMEIPATLDRGEAVLNRRGVQAMGADNIARANAGLSGGNSGSGPIMIALNGRIIDTITSTSVRRGPKSRMEIQQLSKQSSGRGGYK